MKNLLVEEWVEIPDNGKSFRAVNTVTNSYSLCEDKKGEGKGT